MTSRKLSRIAERLGSAHPGSDGVREELTEDREAQGYDPHDDHVEGEHARGALDHVFPKISPTDDLGAAEEQRIDGVEKVVRRCEEAGRRHRIGADEVAREDVVDDGIDAADDHQQDLHRQELEVKARDDV